MYALLCTAASPLPYPILIGLIVWYCNFFTCPFRQLKSIFWLSDNFFYLYCPGQALMSSSVHYPSTFAGNNVLAGAEEDEQRQLGADETLAGPRQDGHGQVSHGIGRGVDPPQAGAAQWRAARDGLQPLQPGGTDRWKDWLIHIVCDRICSLIFVLVSYLFSSFPLILKPIYSGKEKVCEPFGIIWVSA